MNTTENLSETHEMYNNQAEKEKIEIDQAKSSVKINQGENDNEGENSDSSSDSENSSSSSFNAATVDKYIKQEDPMGEMESPSQASNQFSSGFSVKENLFEFYNRNIKDRKWIATFRSPLSFLHPKNFSVPKSKNDLYERFVHNIDFFLSNYLLLLFVMIIYSIISRPLLILFMGLFFYLYLLIYNRNEIRIYGDIVVKGKVKYSLFSIIAAFFGIIIAGKILIAVLLIFLSLMSFHVIFNDKTVKLNDYKELAIDVEAQ